MDINPNTGKGWTDAQEATFAEIMAASRLNRIQAIQLWKRCHENGSKTVCTARRNYPPLSPSILDRLAKARVARLNAISIEGNPHASDDTYPLVGV